MKKNFSSLSWSDEQNLHDKNLKLVKKSELKLTQLGYTFVTRNTYWIVYEPSGERHIFEEAQDLYKFSYRRRYKQMCDVKNPVFIVK
jgi:hypothetical protein|tara:strand:- start:3248 stop:3508 length:261 start_codon:yes stop_codon:yes gene_type:complete